MVDAARGSTLCGGIILSFSIIGFGSLMWYRRSNDYGLPQDLSGKVIIVTGGTSGIGLSTVSLLAERKATVIIACRDTKKGHGVLSEMQSKSKIALDIKVMELKLNKLQSVQGFAEQFLALNMPLHVLINNAGIVNTCYIERCENVMLT